MRARHTRASGASDTPNGESTCFPVSADENERIFIERMMSDGGQRGLGMKDLRDLKDLMIHDVQPIGDE